MDAKGRESEPVCIDGEIPFEIPEGWEWARLGSLFDMQAGKNIAASNISDKADEVNRVPCFGGNGVRGYVAQPNRDGNHQIIGRQGALCGCVNYAQGPFYATEHAVVVTAFDKVEDAWTGLVLRGLNLNQYATATAQPGLAVSKISEVLAPVPPLAEQRRIAERVSELTPLVEEYGRLEDEREALDAALPERLRKSILQMAVEGMLVPQDPSDEPASVLLDRIREERAHLVKEKKIKAPKGGESVIYLGSDGRRYEKRGKGEPACIDDEIPFDIPEGWEWARFESVLYNRDAERIPVSVAEREKFEKRYDYYGASGVIDKVDKYLFDKPLLLIGEDGANLLARTKPIAFMARGQYWVNNHAHVLDGLSETLLEYIALFINSISLAPYVTGTAQPKMNQAKMNSILIPLPPEEEQARILKRVAELKVLVTNR